LWFQSSLLNLVDFTCLVQREAGQKFFAFLIVGSVKQEDKIFFKNFDFRTTRLYLQKSLVNPHYSSDFVTRAVSV
jgi:hypothetical protein